MGCRTEICARSRAPSNQKTHEPPTPGPLEPLRRLCPQVTSAGGTDRPTGRRLRESFPEKLNCRPNPRPARPKTNATSPKTRLTRRSAVVSIDPAEMASTRTAMQTAANALRLGAYRTGVASSMPLLRCAAPRAFRLSAPALAPRHAAAALPSGIRRYSQKQPGESKIWSFEDVRLRIGPSLPSPPRRFRVVMGTRPGRRALREEWKATRTVNDADRGTDRQKG